MNNENTSRQLSAEAADLLNNTRGPLMNKVRDLIEDGKFEELEEQVNDMLGGIILSSGSHTEFNNATIVCETLLCIIKDEINLMKSKSTYLESLAIKVKEAIGGKDL